MEGYKPGTTLQYARLYYLDLAFPFIYCPLLWAQLGLWLRVFPGSGLPPKSTISRARGVIPLLPLVGGVFDVAENFTVLRLIKQFNKGGEGEGEGWERSEEATREGSECIERPDDVMYNTLTPACSSALLSLFVPTQFHVS